MGCGSSAPLAAQQSSAQPHVEQTVVPATAPKVNARPPHDKSEAHTQTLPVGVVYVEVDTPDLNEAQATQKSNQAAGDNACGNKAESSMTPPDSSHVEESFQGKHIPVRSIDIKGQLFQRVKKCLHAQDKMEFSTAGNYQQFFNLSADVFKKTPDGENPTEYNTEEQLESLTKDLFAPSEIKKGFVTLFSSPLNTVNLDDKGRENGAIPPEATFFSFCNPCAVNTMDARASMAEDLQKGRNRRRGDLQDLDMESLPGHGEAGTRFEHSGADAVNHVQDHVERRKKIKMSKSSDYNGDDPLVRWLLEVCSSLSAPVRPSTSPATYLQ